MKVKKIKGRYCSYNSVDDIFEVKEIGNDYYQIIDNDIYCPSFIKKSDCEIIEDKNSTQEKIEVLCNNFSNFLKEKNKRYGDSALNPENIFPNDDELYIRINDKLARIKENTKNNNPVRKNDLADLYGYISLALIKNNWIEFDDLLD